MAGPDPSKLSTLIGLLISTFELLGKAINFGNRIKRGFSNEGIYEVLEWENNLEIHDGLGKKASFHKREKVSYLQNYVFAYQDVVWGDGKLPVNYRSSPGKLVDRYRLGDKTYLIISLRKVRNKGDVDEFNISWKLKGAFVRGNEQWETKIRHRVKHLRLNVIFPKGRPPTSWRVIEGNVQRVISPNSQVPRKLLDGRWKITWEKNNPRLYESYFLDWDW